MESTATAIKKALRGTSIFLSEKGNFSLATAIFDHQQRETHWLETLKGDLSSKHVFLLVISIPLASDTSLFSEIKKALPQQDVPKGHQLAIAVTGISQHLDKGNFEEGYLGLDLFKQANLDRERLPKDFPYPVLLCLNVGSQRVFLKHAPDLAHWCIHHFQFTEGGQQSSILKDRELHELESSAPGTSYKNREELQASEKIFREGLRVTIAAYGPDHLDAIYARANLANSLMQSGQLTEALELAQLNSEIFRGSEIKEGYSKSNAFGMESFILTRLGNFSEAEPLARKALEIDEASFGKDHPNVAIRLNNLAQLLQDTNRLSEAEPLMRRALEIDETSFGKDHPNVAIRLNNLASLLQDTNRLDEAEPLMRRALEIDETSFGRDHPNVAIRLNNLASLLQATNRLSEAEPLMRRALEIDESSFGKDHPNVANRLNNLASLLKATNRLDEAEPLMRRALEIDETSLGRDHPNVAIRLNNLASLLKATNRLSEAEPLMRRALLITLLFSIQTGHEHPHFQLFLGNYKIHLSGLKFPAEEISEKLSTLGPEAGWTQDAWSAKLKEIQT